MRKSRIKRECPECGTGFETIPSRVKAGRGKYCSKSCGTRANCRRHGHTTHEGSSRTYTTWAVMRQRCTNPNHPKFYLYGARGITVCDEWAKFDSFLDDMGVRPEGKTLDRIDSNGPYSRENCRWATPMEQAQNTRHIRKVSYQGETYSLSSLARKFGIHPTSLAYRIEKGLPERLWPTPPSKGRALPHGDEQAPS